VCLAAASRTWIGAGEAAPERRTSGVGHDPRTTPPEALSTAALRFDLTADFGPALGLGGGGSFVEVDRHCPSCCRCVVSRDSPIAGGHGLELGAGGSPAAGGEGGGQGGDPEILYDVVVMRFAKFGQGAGGHPGIEWLIQMEDGEGLRGRMAVPSDPQGKPVFPGRIRLGGKMIITVEVPGLAPMRLRSRKEPIFEAPVPAWPPYGMELRLTNPPVPYFHEADLDDPMAEPMVTIRENTIALMQQPDPFFAIKPRIARTQVLDPDGVPWQSGPIGGLGIEWGAESEAAEVSSTCAAADSYHVYRNAKPGDLRGWELIGKVPIGGGAGDGDGGGVLRRRFFDQDYDGRSKVEYVVMHAARFPFDYAFEGLYETPTVVDPVIVGGEQRPGDCNQDGTLDISDAVCLLGFQFLGIPRRLPCGDGTLEHPSNRVLLDANGDRNVDLSDAVRLLSFLFLGQPPPPLCRGPRDEPCDVCVRIPGCEDVCAP
jgi:hypothetical protein